MSKNFVYIEDNGDGTSTYTVHIPQVIVDMLGDQIDPVEDADLINDCVTAIVELSFEDIATSLMGVPEAEGTLQDFYDKTTVIPHSPEEF